METIGGQKLWSYDARGQLKRLESKVLRTSDPTSVSNYESLAAHVAELQYKNRDLVLLFRGQDDDYRNLGNRTSIRPNILRPKKGEKRAPAELVERRFKTLTRLDKKLALKADELWADDAATLALVKKHRVLRWALLQHYEICKTPLVDVSHSLRIAASFATVVARKQKRKTAYVFVLGIPNLSGAVTASMEAGVQVVRLSSVCPPKAIRPHIQEGYLLGEYPEVASADQKALYSTYELDFGRRLVAKFKLDWRSFWGASPLFPCVSRDALYPKEDAVAAWAKKLKPARVKRKKREKNVRP